MGYHWNYGICFRRDADGSVLIFETVHDGEEGEWEFASIPAMEWASIVDNVSKYGPLQGRYQQALDFHNCVERRPPSRVIDALKSVNWLAKTRLDDGDELGPSVWRLALQDIAESCSVVLAKYAPNTGDAS